MSANSLSCITMFNAEARQQLALKRPRLTRIVCMGLNIGILTNAE